VYCILPGILSKFCPTKRLETQRFEGIDAGVAPIPPEDAGKKNQVTLTPEGFAAAKKLFGYHCAMCHGETGNGKGDLATKMKLNLQDCRNPSALSKYTDGELFYIITNGHGKMTGGEGDRTKEEVRWNLVSVVRSFADKKAITETAKP
jgi:mono/diheme cytochrome c family protein